MTTPYESYFRMQLAMWEGWTKLMAESFLACDRLVEHQTKMFEHPRFIRWHDTIPRGADWFDHYGHRAHDVDVERV